jgi:L-arabinose isomerase
MDFVDDFLLMGHDGSFHLAIAEGQPTLRGKDIFHGKRGGGVAVEARVKTGPVTILTVTQTADGQLKLLTAEGESLPGPVLQIGNTFLAHRLFAAAGGVHQPLVRARPDAPLRAGDWVSGGAD